jgi:hypothetical protein
VCEPGSAVDLADKVLSVLQDAELRQTLVERGLARAEQFSLEGWETALTRILDDALAERPIGAAPRSGLRRGSQPKQQDRDGSLANLLLERLADAAQARSDVAMREYVVRSGVPLIGPLIAWLRRNLTSHLREPYLDPIVERQVTFNQRTAEWMGRATEELDASGQRQQELEARVAALEAQVARLGQGSPEDEPQGR